ncbi:MAG: DUF1667 domain-containing protein [Clostridia bacterium]|nr:DUF1667 domain-containing protein [Clostridia bacterium]
MKRTFTCIVCPNGCEIDTEYEGTNVISVSGNLCPKGRSYVVQELTDPRRTIASSIRITGGELPLASVRLTQPVPKDRIFDVMNAINQVECPAPVSIGQVILPNVLGLGSDVIITKNVKAKPAP